MQNRPTAGELLEAIRELLTGEIMPTITDGGLRFKALIAANLLSILEREQASGEALIDVELARLANLLQEASQPEAKTVQEKRDAILDLNRKLGARIRAGEADSGEFGAKVQAHVRQTLIDQLKVSNPKFLAKFT
jgi:hypothetical protein